MWHEVRQDNDKEVLRISLTYLYSHRDAVGSENDVKYFLNIFFVLNIL